MLLPCVWKETWKDVAVKTKLSAFSTMSEEAFALLMEVGSRVLDDAGCWMLLHPLMMGVAEAPKQPTFKYTSRTKDHVMTRNSSWTVEDLSAFNILYIKGVAKD
jgi:hypothetical protein